MENKRPQNENVRFRKSIEGVMLEASLDQDENKSSNKWDLNPSMSQCEVTIHRYEGFAPFPDAYFCDTEINVINNALFVLLGYIK